MRPHLQVALALALLLFPSALGAQERIRVKTSPDSAWNRGILASYSDSTISIRRGEVAETYRLTPLSQIEAWHDRSVTKAMLQGAIGGALAFLLLGGLDEDRGWVTADPVGDMFLGAGAGLAGGALSIVIYPGDWRPWP